MSRFNRQWTIELNISVQQFRHTFHRVVQSDERWVLAKPFVLANKQYKDFFGAIQQLTFRIWKRRGVLDFKGVPELYGKIIDKDNSIQLELRIMNNFLFNYFSIIISDLVIAFFLFLVFNGITGIGARLTGVAATAYIIIAGLTMSFVAHYIQLKLVDKYLDNLKDLYTRVLLTTESAANASE
jgi:hypothetical protein